eukprot:scaffold11496_cov46-Cylindrotheca_fusiformis.AAC.1
MLDFDQVNLLAVCRCRANWLLTKIEDGAGNRWVVSGWCSRQEFSCCLLLGSWDRRLSRKEQQAKASFDATARRANVVKEDQKCFCNNQQTSLSNVTSIWRFIGYSCRETRQLTSVLKPIRTEACVVDASTCLFFCFFLSVAFAAFFVRCILFLVRCIR